MERITLKVRMFGSLTLAIGDAQIGCESGRAGQVWVLLSYLLHHRRRIVPADELISLLHMDENGSGALKTAVHRVRSALNRLGEDMGHTLLQYRDGGYGWNPDVVMEVDAERFEEILASTASTEQLLDALSLYTGTFCAMQASEAWVIPVAAYYQNLYLRAVQGAVSRLETESRYEACVTLCRSALKTDSSQEVLYQLMMRSLLALNRRTEVIAVYEDMSRLLLSEFGVMPDQESRALYREALRTVNGHTVTPEALREQLQETGPVSGALLCDFDFFRNVYQAQARVLARSGEAVHVALLSVSGRLDKELTRRSLETAMDNLEAHICKSLRKGDMVTRCSASQIAVMLPHAGYDDSLKVCLRLTDSYMKKYPHTPIRIDYAVQSIDAVE